MRFAAWAPKELVEQYQNSLQSEYQQDQRKQEIVYRLLTRPEMEKVWSWVGSQNLPLPLNSNGGLIGSFFRSLDQFDDVAKAPHSERESDFQEIHNLALQLSIKLCKYQNEHHSFNSYSALIGKEYDDKVFSLLRSEVQEKARNRYFMRQLWGLFMPPIHDVIKALSIAASNSDAKLNRLFPKKIRQDGALKTYLVNVFCGYSFFHEKCPHTIAATFLSVALDDPEITADTVRTVRKDETF